MVPLPPYYFEVIVIDRMVGLIVVMIDGITLVDHGVFVLWGDQEVLDGAATFEVSLDAISTTDLFDTFTKTLCVGYDNMTLTLDLSSGSVKVQNGWFLIIICIIPRQIRFSLYSGAVIREGWM